MLCFLYFLLVVFSIIGLFGLLSYIKILKIWQKPVCLPYLAVLLVGIIILTLYCLFLGAIGNLFDVHEATDPRGALGTLGDYFGGMLNPLLAFLSFIALLAALSYQSKQLEQNAEQLKHNETALEETRKVIKQNERALAQNAQALSINNKELANSTNQLGLATQAHQEIEKTQKLQQFENNFYELFSQLNKLQDDVLFKQEFEIKKILENASNLANTRNMIINNRLISRYFILLYQVLKMIDQKATFTSKDQDEQSQKFYTNLIRSQQDDKILQLLLINCFDVSFLEFRRYLEDAMFFEHVSLTNSIGYNYQLLCTLPYYVHDAEKLKQEKNIPFFDEGLGLKRIAYSNILGIIYDNKSKNLNLIWFVKNAIDMLFYNNNEIYYNSVHKLGFESISILNGNKLKLNFWRRRKVGKPSNFSVKKIEYIKNSTCAKIPMIFSYSVMLNYKVSMEKVILELDRIILNIKTNMSSEEYILSFIFCENKINLIRKDSLGAVDLSWGIGDYKLC